jgi:excinuclease ABC subunit A
VFEGIIVKGAREHNLKSVSIQVPRNKITVFTGLSGSGKSSLAFDTIYAEGQRRYVESLSNYARNFLDQLKKPDVDSITGLSPAIAIDQKSVSTNPRSTVGTVTEIYDFLRLLFARVGVAHCPTHNIPVSAQPPSQIVEDIMKLPEGTKFYILAPMVSGKKGEYLAEFRKWAQKGYLKARIDGEMIDLSKAKKLTKNKAHDIDLVIDQLILKKSLQQRISTSVNTAVAMAKGRIIVELVSASSSVSAQNQVQQNQGSRKTYSIYASCSECGFSFPELEPRMFSFNNPRGACATCNGLGTLDLIEENRYTFSDDGTRKLEKIKYRHRTESIAREDEDDESEVDLEITNCPDCGGARLKPEVLNIFIDKKNISEIAKLSILNLQKWNNQLQWNTKNKIIAEKIQKQMGLRLQYLERVGTGYLSLDRPARTLSGGEAQRIRLATQVGSALVGVLYVMDEPSIGLHPRDHHRLLEIIADLRDLGNTIILVEHDEDTIRAADFVVDLGPRAGKLGGEIMAAKPPSELAKDKNSITGRYLSGELKIPIPKSRRQGNGLFLGINGVCGNNLKNIDLKLPLGTLIGVTGVSGSGKSTLIIDTLFKVLSNKINKSSYRPSPYKEIYGIENIDKVIDINQKPIGRTPRSTPATYVGLLPMIRDLFAEIPDAKIRGYTPGQFSFNVKGGRCEECQGQGQIRVEMNFMRDVFVPCEVCGQRRYNRETLNIKYKGKSIADVLDMSVAEALEFFTNHKLIHRKLETLHRVGLDYMTLGQSSTTLSGGEAQRTKLSKELSKRGTGKTLYILDEPTTGLHFEDIRKLTELLTELVVQGNTVLVIEHNLEVVKICDHIIDIGPEGGDGGGFIVANGTPEEVSQNKKSITGKYIAPLLA